MNHCRSTTRRYKPKHVNNTVTWHCTTLFEPWRITGKTLNLAINFSESPSDLLLFWHLNRTNRSKTAVSSFTVQIVIERKSSGFCAWTSQVIDNSIVLNMVAIHWTPGNNWTWARGASQSRRIRRNGASRHRRNTILRHFPEFDGRWSSPFANWHSWRSFIPWSIAPQNGNVYFGRARSAPRSLELLVRKWWRVLTHTMWDDQNKKKKTKKSRRLCSLLPPTDDRRIQCEKAAWGDV
jgi:hypothetical protein